MAISHTHLRGLIDLRDAKVHMSTIMLLSIVETICANSTHASPAAVYGYYQAKRTKSKTGINYTLSGVASMLRTMVRRKLLIRTVIKGRVYYTPTAAGLHVLDRLGV